MDTRYIALIPAYEPDRKMLGIIADLGKSGFDVVVVDDGSPAEYADIFEQAAEKLPGRSGRDVTLLIHDTNRGKGAALRTGLDHIEKTMIRGDGAADTVIVTVDADGQHLVKDACKAACAARKEPGTLVLGSRYFGKNVPARSRFGNTVTRNVFRTVTGQKIYDTQTGLRAFTGDLIPELLRVKGDRYEYELNVLMDFAGRGIPVREIRIDTVYIDGNSSSHFDTVRDSFRVYRGIAAYVSKGTAGNILKFSASSFASFLIDYMMYAFLLILSADLVMANIGARIVSATANYTINRKMVFRSGKSITRSAAGYFALAGFILAGNTIVLDTMVNMLGIGSMTAKILTEMIFFAISWVVQRYVVFYEDGGRETQKTERRDKNAKTEEKEFTVAYTAVKPKKLRGIRRSAGIQ